MQLYIFFHAQNQHFKKVLLIVFFSIAAAAAEQLKAKIKTVLNRYFMCQTTLQQISGVGGSVKLFLFIYF